MFDFGGFKIKKSARAKRARIKINSDGELVVVLPENVPSFFARTFVFLHKEWIKQKQTQMRARRATRDARLHDFSRESYLKHKKQAELLCQEKVAYWAEKMHITYRSIKIKNTRSRWGSASSKGNLNFNYKIIFLPDELADYLVVHELAHLKELNHSKKFWHIVSQHIPDYKEKRKRLKELL